MMTSGEAAAACFDSVFMKPWIEMNVWLQLPCELTLMEMIHTQQRTACLVEA